MQLVQAVHALQLTAGGWKPEEPIKGTMVPCRRFVALYLLLYEAKAATTDSEQHRLAAGHVSTAVTQCCCADVPASPV